MPPPFCADAIMEAADAGHQVRGLRITDGIPAQDMMMVKRYMRRYPKEKRTMLVGPNCAGVIIPGQGDAGHHAGAHLHRRATSAS